MGGSSQRPSWSMPRGTQVNLVIKNLNPSEQRAVSIKPGTWIRYRRSVPRHRRGLQDEGGRPVKTRPEMKWPQLWNDAGWGGALLC